MGCAPLLFSLGCPILKRMILSILKRHCCGIQSPYLHYVRLLRLASLLLKIQAAPLERTDISMGEEKEPKSIFCLTSCVAITSSFARCWKPLKSEDLARSLGFTWWMFIFEIYFKAEPCSWYKLEFQDSIYDQSSMSNHEYLHLIFLSLIASYAWGNVEAFADCILLSLKFQSVPSNISPQIMAIHALKLYRTQSFVRILFDPSLPLLAEHRQLSIPPLAGT